MYTNEPDVYKLSTKVLPYLVLVHLFNGIQAHIQGPIRALGLHNKNVIIAVACYYIISMPLAVIFAFLCEWSCIGLWTGIAIGVAVLCILLGRIVWISDW